MPETNHPIQIRAVGPADREWVRQFTAEHWGSDKMITRGKVLYISEQEGFIAEMGGEVVGFVSFRVEGPECEITSLDSMREGLGTGSRLIEQVAGAARVAGCTRLFLITTNDNLHALRFYQRRGFRLAALYPGAVNESRKLKPEIPLIGNDGIPLRDEIELEMDL
jgi:ribosomal protein S18 acetylase RimI-like enzyme